MVIGLEVRDGEVDDGEVRQVSAIRCISGNGDGLIIVHVKQ